MRKDQRTTLPNLPAVVTTLTRDVIPGRSYVTDPVLHVRNILPELEHLPHLFFTILIDDRDRRGLRSFRSPVVRHLDEVSNNGWRQGLGVRNKFFHVGTKYEFGRERVWKIGQFSRLAVCGTPYPSTADLSVVGIIW